MPSTPLIRATGITRTYGRAPTESHALRGIDLDIHAGESLAIIGKSGSGKSTLMHLLALLDQPTAGRIEIDGTDSTGLSASALNALRNKRFGFVFQQFFLTAGQSVLDNVSLPLTIARVPKQQRVSATLAALEAVGLADMAHNRATDLSGGQKQRVVIARALVNNPSVIFADEPTGNLDSSTGAHIEDMLFSLQADRGITLVVVTHDPDLARRCDRAVTVADGHIENATHPANPA
ncbi:ABC transporter ATP-binding protein [Micrococcales bacterium 31B]|nr:ABC transporter ATP-binding protein [Micrococcales bacterium 31B]